MAVMSEPTPVPEFLPRDIVSLQEASAMFQETGRPASPRTLKRRARAAGVTVVRHGAADHASFSDLLQVHAAMYPPD